MNSVLGAKVNILRRLKIKNDILSNVPKIVISDSKDGRDQDCMSLYSLSGFTWHDSGCEAKFHPLCELWSIS